METRYNNAENQLSELVGRDDAKAKFNKLREVFQLSRQHQVPPPFNSFIVLKGNPGTGKTTMGRLFAKTLYEDGVLQNDNVVVVTPFELLGQYIGQTSANTIEIFNRAKGGTLFIDECSPNCDGFNEFIITLIHLIGENKDTLVILSGYSNEIDKLLHLNPALQSRISLFIELEDFTDLELLKIFEKKLNEMHYKIDDDTILRAMDYFSKLPRNKHFGNAREVDKLIQEFQSSLQKDIVQSNTDSKPLNDTINNDVTEKILAETKKTINDLSSQVNSLKESMCKLQEVIDNIQVNVSMMVENQASAKDVAALQRENEAFRSDSNMKLMRRYGIDAMIKSYQNICEKIFRIHHAYDDTDTGEAEIKTLNWVLKRMNTRFKNLDIRLRSSQLGATFDGSTMVVFGSEGEEVEDSDAMVETKESKLKGTVKESVSPAFFWTIPSLIGDAKEWCMEPEKICIYK